MGGILVDHDTDTLQLAADRLFRGAGIRRGMQVLDLGCGTGDLSIAAAELVGPNGLVLGIDVDADVLETARRRAWEADLDQVYFLGTSLENLRDEGPFDVILVRMGSHLNSKAILSRAARLLRENGLIAVLDESGAVTTQAA